MPSEDRGHVKRSRRHEYPGLTFMPSRIPVLDALAVFVADGESLAPDIEAALRSRESRWYPVQGGHDVLIPCEDQPSDESVFTLRPGAWDHQTCDACRVRISPMTLCWVTESGPHVLLCAECYGEASNGEEAG